MRTSPAKVIWRLFSNQIFIVTGAQRSIDVAILLKPSVINLKCGSSAALTN